MRASSINAEAANQLLQRVMADLASPNYKLTGGIAKPNVLRIISQIYQEKLKQTDVHSGNPPHVMLYDYFINKYGLKKVAENKCVQVITKCEYSSADGFIDDRVSAYLPESR